MSKARRKAKPKPNWPQDRHGNRVWKLGHNYFAGRPIALPLPRPVRGQGVPLYPTSPIIWQSLDDLEGAELDEEWERAAASDYPECAS